MAPSSPAATARPSNRSSRDRRAAHRAAGRDRPRSGIEEPHRTGRWCAQRSPTARRRSTGALVADDTEAMLVALAELGVTDRRARDDARRRRHARRGPRRAGRAPGPAVGHDGALPRAGPRRRRRPVPPRRLRAAAGAADGPGHRSAPRASAPTSPRRASPGTCRSRSAAAARGGRVELPGHVSSQFLSGLLLAGPLFPDGVAVHLTTPAGVAAVRRAHPIGHAGVRRVRRRHHGRARHVPRDELRRRARCQRRQLLLRRRRHHRRAGDRRGPRPRRSAGRPGVRRPARARWVPRSSATPRRRRCGAAVALRGITADLADLSDTAQTLAAVAVFADSPTTITGIDFIRRKETDRIADTVANLRRCGIEATEDADGMTIHPGTPTAAADRDPRRPPDGDELRPPRSAGARASTSLDPQCVAKTYPGFFADLDQLRGQLGRVGHRHAA